MKIKPGPLTAESELAWITESRDPIEVAWAAGFFDGEGCVYLHKNKARKPYLGISIGQAGTKEELSRFANAVGMESVRITGPFQRGGGKWTPAYRFVVVGKRAHLVMQLLLPLICSRKRAKYFYLVAEGA